jgi:hypothetical protein
MTKGISPQILRSLPVDQFKDNFNPLSPTTYEGGFVMEIALGVGDVETAVVAPGFAVPLTAEQVDRVMADLQDATSVKVVRDSAAAVDVAVVAGLAGQETGVVVISDPGPGRRGGSGLVALLVVPLPA